MKETREWQRQLTILIISFLAGYFGLDRFYRGEVALGVIKLITCGVLNDRTYCPIVQTVSRVEVVSIRVRRRRERPGQNLMCSASFEHQNTFPALPTLNTYSCRPNPVVEGTS